MVPTSVIHLDTRVAVWLYLEDTTRIPATVRARLDAEDLVLAPMVVLEMEYLHRSAVSPTRQPSWWPPSPPAPVW